MDGYKVVIELDDVAQGDAETLAQSIWDANADDFDAAQGDFRIHIVKVADNFSVDVNWEPTE